MGSGAPFRLLLAGLLTFRSCNGDRSSYTIDTVSLTVEPNDSVGSGTPVTLRCEVRVSHDPSLHLTQRFQFLRYDKTVYAANTTDTEARYELSPARVVDSGVYQCQVTVQEKSKISPNARLAVTGLQVPVLKLSQVEVFESETVIANCSAPEEKGSLRFHFYRGESQKIKQVESTGNSAETRLVLEHAGDTELYCDYDIPTMSEVGHSLNSKPVPVLIKALYISPIMNVLPSKSVFEGDTITVYCKVVNPPPNVQVFLIKDKSILSKESISLEHRMTVQVGDSGELVCKAEWGDAQKETAESIIVNELFSKPQMILNPSDVYEGELFTLTCSISSYSERIDKQSVVFSIYKDDREIGSNPFSEFGRPSLNGNYTCKARAQLNPSQEYVQKESTAVAVEAKVSVSAPLMRVLGGRLIIGKPFELQCESEQGSLPITYTLFSPDRQPEVKVVSMPEDQAIFNISVIHKTSDIERFLCHASNNIYEAPRRSSWVQLQRDTVIIEPVSKPTLSIKNWGSFSEGQDLTLVCSVKRGTTPVTFSWYHDRKKARLGFQIAHGHEGLFVLKTLRGEHEGEYFCESSNEAGEVRRSSSVAVAVKMAGWKKGLIAALCILFTIALILVIVIKKRLLPFKGKRTTELSVKSASTKGERLSLTQAEVVDSANATPGVMGRNVWSEHVSGSESDDQISVAPPEEPGTQYTEVQPPQAHPSRAPMKKGTDTVYSEVRNSKQGASDQLDGASVEYAQLNHDASQLNGPSSHGDQENHIDDIDDIDDIDNVNLTNHGECNHDDTPDC